MTHAANTPAPKTPCSNCITDMTLDPEAAGKLRSRDFALTRIRELSFDLIGGHKDAEPAAWFGKVAASVAAQGFIQPVLLVRNADGLELIDGNHRAWISYSQGIDIPARLFVPSCGECTETDFRESAMAHTAQLGWQY